MVCTVLELQLLPPLYLMLVLLGLGHCISSEYQCETPCLVLKIKFVGVTVLTAHDSALVLIYSFACVSRDNKLGKEGLAVLAPALKTLVNLDDFNIS